MPRKYKSQAHLRNVQQPQPPMPAPPELGWFDRNFNKAKQREHEVAQLMAERDAMRYAEQKNAFDLNQARRQDIEQNNQMYRERRAQMAGLPPLVRGNPIAQGIGDQVVNAQHMGQNIRNSVASIPVVPTAAALGAAGALGVAGSGALAYGQLTEEGLPSGPMSVGGRMAMNAYDMLPGMGIGQDPLAEARRSVQEAQAQLGSDNMLEAIVLDQLTDEPLQGENSEAFQAKVATLAEQIRNEGSVNSNGEWSPTPAHQAWDAAYKVVKAAEYGG